MFGWAVVVAFGSFVFGYQLVCMSIMADQIKASYPIPPERFEITLSILTTLLPIGAFIGNFNLIKG